MKRGIAAAIGVVLAAWGAYAIVEAARGSTQGTDTSPGFGYVVGVPLALVGIGIVAAAIRRR